MEHCLLEEAVEDTLVAGNLVVDNHLVADNLVVDNPVVDILLVVAAVHIQDPMEILLDRFVNLIILKKKKNYNNSLKIKYTHLDMASFHRGCILEASAVVHMKGKEYLLTLQTAPAYLAHKLDMVPHLIADLEKELEDFELVEEVLEALLF